MKVQQVKQRVSGLWSSLAEGWQRLRESAASALTRFRPGAGAKLPAAGEVDDQAYLPSLSWSKLGGDLFEDDRRLFVRLEVPGMDKKAFDIEVLDDALIVSGEKRFERASSDGRYRMLQCAYGRFRRVVPLPAPVRADGTQATYTNGVLKVELPKRNPGRPKRIAVQVG